MHIIEPKVEFIGGNVPYYDRAKHVEVCGRVCYKSEEKITQGSAEKFISGVIKRGHEAVLEHARITLNLSEGEREAAWGDLRGVSSVLHEQGIEPYLCITGKNGTKIASGNIRAWRNISDILFHREFAGSIQTGMGSMLNDITKTVFKRMWHENIEFFPEFIQANDPYVRDTLADINPGNNPMGVFSDPALRKIHSWYTFRFICDRGVTHEIVRHRPASYCQESTRYCDYSNGKFGGEITVIKPFYLQEGSLSYDRWFAACAAAEQCYFDMRREGCSPQEARAVLPNSLKTDIWMTCNLREWRHILKLRAAGTTGKPHPQMAEVMVPLLQYFKKYLPDVFFDIEVPA